MLLFIPWMEHQKIQTQSSISAAWTSDAFTTFSVFSVVLENITSVDKFLKINMFFNFS